MIISHTFPQDILRLVQYVVNPSSKFVGILPNIGLVAIIAISAFTLFFVAQLVFKR